MPEEPQAKFFFSLRSPYSWLSYLRFVECHGDLVHKLRWIPTWEPDGSTESALRAVGGSVVYTEMSRAKNLYILRDVTRRTRESGTAMKWPLDRQPVWEVPHLAYLRAHDHGRGAEYVAAAYRARWEQGRDICDRSTVAEIGESLGLDPDELATASDDPGLRERGVRCLLEVGAEEVFGVPFFVTGSARFWGVDRLEEFVEEVRSPRVSSGSTADDESGRVTWTLDYGHAGGCG
ncbi:2-hydroxychromene-2-carboxylate isomerase [Actinopolyspora lacussalsi subsp. righensis]|uniref:2-hydroxychromene-2-carboxylate isomerase n=1 Tax=Actinopolyspora righensis TaxID=995060 RepID=A0A1I7BA96_9ACTN|nr:DsbA family protein [Actinopolyspora righensis]SFT84120.1 2-hydroxychromene-2-carboxylate isomerase [Actinopolyspora righensis]